MQSLPVGPDLIFPRPVAGFSFNGVQNSSGPADINRAILLGRRKASDAAIRKLEAQSAGLGVECVQIVVSRSNVKQSVGDCWVGFDLIFGRTGPYLFSSDGIQGVDVIIIGPEVDFAVSDSYRRAHRILSPEVPEFLAGSGIESVQFAVIGSKIDRIIGYYRGGVYV